MLPPLASLAVSLLPNLAKRVAANVIPGVEQKLTDTVSEFLGTDDVVVAQQMIEDPKVAAELRIRLAEIELEADRIETEREDKRRQDELATFQKALEDTRNARSTMVDLAKEKSPLSAAPALVSLVVVIGFFGTLYYLIHLMRTPVPAGTDNAAVLQIVNIAVGALTAGFATVISFWLGSSQGSRNKDDLSAQAQETIARLQTTSAQTTREIVADQASLFRQSGLAAAPGRAAGPAPKDAGQFGRCADIVFRHEGGFARRDDNPDETTNFGITLKILTAALGTAATLEDLQNLSQDQARQIYRSHFWNALNCDNLPAGVDLVVFDFGVDEGFRVAATMLQKSVHVEADGEIGQITVGAARALDPAQVINTFSDARLAHYQTQPKWPEFQKGWTARVGDTRQRALEMARGIAG